MKSSRLALCLITCCALFVVACGQSEDAAKQASKEDSEPLQQSERAGPQPDYNGRMPGEPLYQKPEWPREIRKEVLGGNEIFSTPRILFMAEIYGDKLFAKQEKRSLWSMRPDGSDRRLVASWDEYSYKDGGIQHAPIRSTNNRYIALSLADSDLTFYRAILDLKTREKWIIHQGGGKPEFNWTSDSENLIFYSDGKHYNYHLPSRTLTERPIIYSSGLFLLPGDKQFLAFKNNGYWIHRFNGDVVRKVEFDFPESTDHQTVTISPGGRLLYFTSTGQWSNVVDIKSDTLLKRVPRKHFIGDSTYPQFLDDKNLYVYIKSKYRVINALTGEKQTKPVDERFIWSMAGIHSLTIFNNQPTNNLN